MEGSVPVFAAILLAEVVRAVGETCLSGASAGLAGRRGGRGPSRAPLPAGGADPRACWLVGIGASVGLASIQLALPIVVGGLLSIGLAGLLALTMPERGFRPSGADTTGGRPAPDGAHRHRPGPAASAAADLPRRRGGQWRLQRGVRSAVGGPLPGRVRLPRARRIEPVVWFGILQAVALLLGIVAVQAMTRLDLRDDRVLARWLIVTNSLWVVAVVGFGLAPDFAERRAGVLDWPAPCESVGQPLMSSWVIRSIPSQVRATVLSTLSQGDALGQMLGGPVVGAIGSTYSLRAAMVATAVLHAPKLLLLARARRLLGSSGGAHDAEPDSNLYAQR